MIEKSDTGARRHRSNCDHPRLTGTGIPDHELAAQQGLGTWTRANRGTVGTDYALRYQTEFQGVFADSANMLHPVDTADIAA